MTVTSTGVSALLDHDRRLDVTADAIRAIGVCGLGERGQGGEGEEHQQGEAAHAQEYATECTAGSRAEPLFDGREDLPRRLSFDVRAFAQRQRAAGDSVQRDVPPIVHDVLRSPGRPLDREARALVEPRFGHDFSRVRVHTGAQAAESAQAVNAVAYTVGNHVVFGAGQYAPHSPPGMRVLAHELTHVVQQRGASVSETTPLRLGQSNDALEREAAHGTATAGTAPAGTVQRQLITPQAAGGGFGGLLDRDRSSAFLKESTAAGAPAKKIKVWFNAFIPQAQIVGPPGSACFTGDGRSFSNNITASSRTHQEIEFDVATLAKSIDYKDTGTTHEVDCKTGAEIAAKKAPASELTNGSVARRGGEIQVGFQTAAFNPLVTVAPAIDADVVFHIDPAARTCRLAGQHDGFPAYEAYVTADGGAGSTVYTYDPIGAGEGISALGPPMDKTVGGVGTRF